MSQSSMGRRFTDVMLRSSIIIMKTSIERTVKQVHTCKKVINRLISKTSEVLSPLPLFKGFQ